MSTQCFDEFAVDYISEKKIVKPFTNQVLAWRDEISYPQASQKAKLNLLPTKAVGILQKRFNSLNSHFSQLYAAVSVST